MMREKQDAHSRAQLFMRRLAHKTVCHQKQQHHSQRGIDCELDFLNRPHFCRCYSPRPAAQSRTVLLGALEENR